MVVAHCGPHDYDDIVDELGPTSPQALLARELYAAAVFDAAQHQVLLPPLEPMLSTASGAPPHHRRPRHILVGHVTRLRREVEGK